MDEDKIIKILEDVASIKSDLANAIAKVSEHILAGSKWRLAIVCSCIGLVGTIVSFIVRFSVIEYKVTMLQANQDKIQVQIYDLNYEKGRAVGLSEKR